MPSQEQFLKRLRTGNAVHTYVKSLLELPHAFLCSILEDRIDLGIPDAMHKEASLEDADEQSLVSLCDQSSCLIRLRAEKTDHSYLASVNLSKTLL